MRTYCSFLGTKLIYCQTELNLWQSISKRKKSNREERISKGVLLYLERFFKNSNITSKDVEDFCTQTQIEHLYIELKENIDDINNLLEPTSSFANAKGGLLILGVTNVGKKGLGKRLLREE